MYGGSIQNLRSTSAVILNNNNNKKKIEQGRILTHEPERTSQNQFVLQSPFHVFQLLGIASHLILKVLHALQYIAMETSFVAMETRRVVMTTRSKGISGGRMGEVADLFVQLILVV